MLILRRKVGEKIVTTYPDGTQIEYVIMGVRGDKIRVGVHAPDDVTIHREEIQARVDAGLPPLRSSK